MAVTLKLDTAFMGVPDATQTEGVYQGTVTFSGSYTSGGDTASFAALVGLLSNALPLHVEVYEEPQSGQSATGWQAVYVKGSTQANGKLSLWNGTTQFSAGAYGTTFSTTTFKFRAWFPLNQ